MSRIFEGWTARGRVSPRQRIFFHGCVTLAVAILAVIYDYWRLPVITFGVDDAYITLHNAQVLAAGGTDSFGVPGLVGATSAFHVVLVRLLLLVASPLRALSDVEWLGVWVYALGIGRMALDHGSTRRTAFAWIVGMLLVAHTSHQLMNGLETGWALGMLTWALVLSHATRPWERWLFPVVVGQLPFLRPELVALVPLLIAGTAWEAENSTRARVRRVLVDCALVGVTMLPWLLVYWTNTGVPYPTTIPAKRYFFSEACLPAATRWDFASGSVLTLAGYLGTFAATIVFLPRTVRGRLLLVFLLLDFCVYFVQLPGALGHYGYRYQYVALPMLAYGALRLETTTGLAVRAFLAFAMTFHGLIEVPLRLVELKNGQRFTAAELVGVADWLEDNTAEGDVILLHDVGYVGYALQGRRLVDVVGLKTPANIHYHRDLTAPSCGRRRGESTHLIALETHAQYIVVLDGWERSYKFVEQLGLFGWKTELVRPDAAYRVFKLTPPGAW